MTTLYTALLDGALYALIAVGFNIVFIATGTFNFAQAQFVMLGTFVAWIFGIYFHMNPLLVILIGFAIGGVIGAVEERIAIRLLPGQGTHGELVTTVGFAVIIEGLAIALFGSNPQPVQSFLNPDSAITLFGGRVYPHELLLIGVGVSVVGLAELLSRRTMLGLASLASAENRVAAVLRGINVGRLSIGAYVLACGMCVAVGPIIAPSTYATATIGDALNLKAFVALAIGGFGSPKGALLGGLAAGLVEAFTGRYLNAGLGNLAVLVLLLVVLTIRPMGLFGERIERVV
jgi:branched-chain amino acid transport system permease protein